MGKTRNLPNPWLAAGAGLMLGLVGRTLSSSSASDVVASDDQRIAPERVRPGMANSVPRSDGPTLRLLRESAGFSADECEEFVREHLGSAGKEIEFEAVFRRWLARSSAEEILAKMAETEGGPKPRGWETAFFRAWFAMDEGRAMEPAEDEWNPQRALLAIENGDSSFGYHYSRRYLQAPRDFWTSNRHGSSETESTLAALTRLGRERPELARTIADADLPNNSLRTDAITAVARGWAATDPEAAWKWIHSQGLGRQSTAVHHVLAEWVKTDPEAVRAAMETADITSSFAPVPDEPLGILAHPDHAQSHLAVALARDPFVGPAGLHALLLEADIDWENGTDVSPAINQPGWYPVDPELAARQAERLPPGRERDLIMQAVADNWIAHDRDQALAFAEKHGIESRHIARARNASDEATRRAALAEPERTFAALFDPNLQPIDGLNHEQLQALAYDWARADPVAASEWLVTQPILSDRQWSSLISNTMGFYWARHDPIGASRWMESLPEGPLRSKVWSAIQEEVTRYSPDLAFELTATYDDGPFREHRLKNDLEAIVQSIGRPAAVELLNSLDLSAGERSILAETLRDEP